MISTRRFFARPSGVSLGATGEDLPKPFAVSDDAGSPAPSCRPARLRPLLRQLLVGLVLPGTVGVPLDVELQVGCVAMMPASLARFSRAAGWSLALPDGKLTPAMVTTSPRSVSVVARILLSCVRRSALCFCAAARPLGLAAWAAWPGPGLARLAWACLLRRLKPRPGPRPPGPGPPGPGPAASPPQPGGGELLFLGALDGDDAGILGGLHRLRARP